VRIAAREAGVDLPDELLTGPTAITFIAGDPVAVAKVLRAFSKDHPALIVKGLSEIPQVQDVADLYKAGIGGSRLLELPDTGHLPSVERPGELTAALVEFLNMRPTSKEHSW
jgi:pimeloyl-ACP methyl ester carboxylesterase